MSVTEIVNRMFIIFAFLMIDVCWTLRGLTNGFLSDTLVAVVADLHTGGSVLYGRFA